MVRSNVAFQNVDVVCPADLSDQITYLHRNVTPQSRLAVLRDEHEVVVQAINGVGRLAVVAHPDQRTASILKASPEGEGFHPSPRTGY